MKFFSFSSSYFGPYMFHKLTPPNSKATQILNYRTSSPFTLSLTSMALRKTLGKRLFDGCRAPSPSLTLEHSPVFSPSLLTRTNFRRDYLTTSDPSENGIFRRFLHRRAVYNSAAIRFPEILSLPVGEKLREKLRGINITRDLLRIDGLRPQPPDSDTVDSLYGISVKDAKKILRLSQVEKLKAILKEIPKTSISYSEFFRICVDGCESEDQGAEFAKMLDESGNVIVLGNVVFLHPELVAKTMESLISNSIANPNDPRREELEKMEKKKGMIDQKAESLVRGELYCGLSFILVQTVAFMRLTFWELSWDVMEPICFFVTSLHFGVAYAFFLRTSTEPSFEGYFNQRFKAKQERLMKTHKFDMERYKQLRKACYPEYNNQSEASYSLPRFLASLKN
ncbi:Calcium uniporter, mitochondrial [Quillaja saponaria]|uniref:Calcium uniporter, mitochondrial n=1 Tax=Quillaja saponaria TaxID=32244 RepID=A0AAD7LYQ9_QUISA|nr:Calcium uniporter, mitochondrial [Quillaja saponaria]